MIVERTPLEGVLLFSPRIYGDARGFFRELFRSETYAQAGISLPFVQDNHSRSGRNILRGMHFQQPNPQGKLVSVMRGRVFDVAVDIRRGSPSFGRWYGTVLDDESGRQLWLPPGFAHGFCVLSEEVDFMYKCTDYYRSEHEFVFRWDDPAIGIRWPLETAPRLSAKDAQAPLLADLDPACLPVYERSATV